MSSEWRSTQRKARSYPRTIASNPRSEVRANHPSFSSFTGRRRRPAMVGVTVSETIADSATAMLSVTANSRNSRPMIPPMSRMGMKTAISDTVIDTMVKPICLAPSSAASSGFFPSSMRRAMFSVTTMASSTTKPVEMVSAISDRLSML